LVSDDLRTKGDMAAHAYKISRGELMAELDRMAQAELGISGDEFLARYRTGKLDKESPAIAQIAVLARLITDDR
jgi:hypothetical protein